MHSSNVELTPPPPPQRASVRAFTLNARTCSDVGGVLVLNDPPARPNLTFHHIDLFAESTVVGRCSLTPAQPRVDPRLTPG